MGEMHSHNEQNREDSKPSAVCSDCSADLSAIDDAGDVRKPCPNCGSTNRTFRVLVEGTLDLYSSLNTKQKRPGHQRPIREGLTRHGPGGDGKVVRVVRSIDRLSHRYTERVEMPDGTVVVDKDEDLRQHRDSSQNNEVQD